MSRQTIYNITNWVFVTEIPDDLEQFDQDAQYTYYTNENETVVGRLSADGETFEIANV